MNKNVIIAIIVTAVIFAGALYFFFSTQGKFSHDNLRFSFKCPEDWKMLASDELAQMGYGSAHIGCLGPDDASTFLLQVIENQKSQTSAEISEELIWQAEQAEATVSDKRNEDYNGNMFYFHTVSMEEMRQSIGVFANEEYVYSMFFSTHENRYAAYYPAFKETLNELDIW